MRHRRDAYLFRNNHEPGTLATVGSLNGAGAETEIGDTRLKANVPEQQNPKQTSSEQIIKTALRFRYLVLTSKP